MNLTRGESTGLDLIGNHRDALGDMRVVRTIVELTDALAGARPAFVPTMGALHEGHLALIRKAAAESRSAGEVVPVVVSIFVNPTQFGPGEDYARYPRQLESDVNAAEAAGASIAFAPDVATMYPPDESIDVPPLPDVATQPQLEDAHRPTHFAGVCQVVARLFDLVQPGPAIFGEKDYQQLCVISAMAAQQRDRWPDLRIVPHPTIREADGLAMSSRNAYLKPEQRDRALGLWRALNAARTQPTPADAERAMQDVLGRHHLEADYAVMRDAATLMPIDSFGRPARALIAARLETVRLIDNIAIEAVSR